MARKTIDVAQLRKQVNGLLAESICSADARQGMINVLEHVLHDTGNYEGFQYLNKYDVPAGTKPGINTSYKPRNDGGQDLMVGNTPFEDSTHNERFDGTDRTRVRYY